jgi:hypothetical protein
MRRVGAYISSSKASLVKGADGGDHGRSVLDKPKSRGKHETTEEEGHRSVERTQMHRNGKRH